jgi:hypothetical protein
MGVQLGEGLQVQTFAPIRKRQDPPTSIHFYIHTQRSIGLVSPSSRSVLDVDCLV